MAQKWIKQADGTFKPAGSTTKKWKKKADGTFEEVQSVSTTAGAVRPSGGITSPNKSGITVSGNQSTATSGITGAGLSAGISKEQQARITAEENILKQYGSYEEFQQKNATDNKSAAALILAPGATSATKNTLEKAEQGAYEKLIEDETYRLLSESYYAYEQELDDLDSKSQEQETDVLQGLDDETKELLEVYANGYSAKDKDVLSGNAFGQADIRAANKKSAEKALKKKGYSEEDIESLAAYTVYYSADEGKEREKARTWAAKQRKNLETIQGLDSETKEQLKLMHRNTGGDTLLHGGANLVESELEKKGYSKDEMESLADTLVRAENANDAKEWRAEVAERVNRSAVDAAANSVGSVFANLGSGAGLFPAITARMQEVATGEYVPIDTNDPLYRPGEFRDITRTNVSQNIEDSVDSKAAKKILPMLYNAGMSTADTFTASALGGMLGGTAKAGEVLSLATMSAGAASSGTQEAFNRTGDTGKALTTGIAAGVIEYATEKISLDHAWDIIRNSGRAAGKSWIVNLLAQAGIEGSEETASEIANRIVDDMVNGGMSQYNRNVQQYKDNGEDEKTAEKLATQDFLAQVLDSFSTGALAGLMGGGISTALSKKPSKGAQAVIDAEVDSRIAAKEEETGKKLKMKEKAAIREQAMKDLSNGRISIDTIEKTLGGETYEKYKAVQEQEETLRKEFDTLNRMKQGEMTGEQLDRRAELKEQLKELEKTSNKAELKKQLSREVKELAGNDEFLRESYNEDERHREAYQIDESVNYSKKQREIVQKAADSGILNNTRKTHEFVDLVARLAANKGVSFDFTNNKKLKESGFAITGKIVNGFVNDGTITVNIQSNKALDTVVGHEITHVLEGTELYSALQQAVKEYATVRGEYDSRLAELTELYKGVEGANVENELTAELVGEYLFSDPDFVNHLATKNQNLFQKLFSEIRYMAKIATAGSKEAQKLEELKRAFERAYRESSTKSESGVQYSLMEFTEDGRRFVEIDQEQDRFEGHDRSEYPRIAKDIINEKFNGKVIGTDNQMFVNGRGRDEYVHPSRPIKEDYVYDAKMRASTELDNLLDAGTNYRNEADGKDGHVHQNTVGGFDYYDTLFKVGDNYFEAVVNIENIKNGKLFKDVTKIKDVTEAIMNSYGKNPKFQFLRTSSTTSVPQNQQNASENSKKSGEVTYSLSAQDDTAPIDPRLTYGSEIAPAQKQQTAQPEVTAKYQAAVDQVLDMQNTKPDHLIIGYTPTVYSSLGMPSLPFVIGTGHVYSAAKTEVEARQDGNYHKGVHYHGLGADAVKNIYEALQDPVMIIASKDVSKTAIPMRSTHSVVAIVDVGSSQKSLLLPVEITAERTVDGVQMDVNTLSSAYEKTVTNLVNEAIAQENAGEVGIYYAKKEALTLPAAGVQFPIRLQQSIASDGIVHSFSEKVNMNISDVTQSQQFKRWFGDWQNNPESASKVVDADGKPLIMYHGTRAENGDFTVFDYSKAVIKGGHGLKALGKGNYFTSKRLDGSERFGNRIIQAYLNIKNPFVYDASYGDMISLAEQVSQKTGENTEGLSYNALQEKMRELGYDGVIEYRRDGTLGVAVTFDSNQIKSATDNIGTFDSGNPDIRYSLSAQDDTAPINPRLTYGSDIALEQDNTIPIRQDIAGKEIAPAQKGVSQYLKPYSEHQKENWKNSKSIVVYENDTQFQNFLEDAKEHKIPGKKMYFGKMADEVAQRVMNELGYDIADYNCSIKADEVEKIFKSHGNEEYENARGQRAVTDNDFKRIPEVMGNPDTIEFAGAYKGKPAIKFVKDGHTIIAVMSDKHLDLYVQTMYIGKKNRSLATPIDESPLSYTPEARSGTAPNGNIPQSTENVTQNIETADSVPIRDDIAVDEVRPSESPKTVKEVNQIKRDNYRIELERLQKEAKQVHQDFNEDIAEKQAEYSQKKDKSTKAARDLQRRIDSLKTRRDNADADYERRANKLREQIAKMGTEEFKRAEQRQTKQNEYRERMRELMGDTSTWVDKKLGISYQVNTLKRNLRDIVRTADGKRDIARADAIYDELQGKYNHNEALLNREANEIKDKYRKLDINKWEDAYIQMLGEHKYNPDCELTAEELTKFYEKHKEQIDTTKVDAVIEDVRTLYDSLFERVNTVLREQGMKEIGYRQGYFPHFTQDKQGWLAKLLNWKTRSDNIPTDIAGITENFNPDRSWQSFNKHRTGDTTDYSFMKGLDSYVNGALDWIYHIEDIQKRRAFENEIRYSHSEKGIQEKLDAIYKNEEYDADEMQAQIDAALKEAKNPLNNFVTDFRNATNNLAGKKSTADRGLEYLTNRKVYSTMTNLSNRVSANMVGGSISSALTNFIPITQSWSAVSPVSSLKAMRDTIKSYIRDDGMVGQSDFLTNRLNQAENLYESGWDKANKAVGFMMDCIDSFTSQTVWRSKYMENVKSGMEQQEAIRNADEFTEGLMAGRSRGNMPTIFNSKNPLTKMFTAFQLEVANQYGYMFKDMPQDIGSRSKFRLTKGYAAMFIGAYVYNALYSSLTGRDSAFDPIGILEELLKDLGVIGDDDDKEEDLLGAAGNLAENLLDETPFVGGLLGGGRVPISSAFPYDDPVSMVKGTFTDISEGDWKGLTSEWMNPLYYLVMPMGGGQLKKTMQGLSMFDDDLPISGSYTNSGNLRFPVEDTVGNRIQAAIFGQYANKNAREYFDSGQSPLKEKQIQEYKELDIPIQDYWKYREGLKGLDTMEEKTEYIAGLDLPVSKKNILINNASNRKDYIDLTGYENFKDFEEFDFSIKNPAKYEFLKDNDISYEEYSAYENHKEAYDWAYQNQEKFEVAKAAAGGAVAYRKYAKAIDKIEADRSSNGKAVSGSRKKKVAEYINGLNLERGQKLLLYKAAYPSDDSYNQEIVNYLNSRKDISYKGMETILKELGFTIGANGRVYW